MERKDHRVERLFAAIGEVDEAYLAPLTQPAPASSVRRSSKTARSGRGAVALRCLAAMLVCAVTLACGMYLLPMLKGSGSADDREGLREETLLLTHISQMTAVREEKAIDLFSGTPMLICRFSPDDAYYLYPLSGTYAELLAGGGKALSAEGSAEKQLRVWVSDGCGNVYSPQLAAHAGNRSFGCLTEYYPEQELSERALNYLLLQFT